MAWHISEFRRSTTKMCNCPRLRSPTRRRRRRASPASARPRRPPSGARGGAPSSSSGPRSATQPLATTTTTPRVPRPPRIRRVSSVCLCVEEGATEWMDRRGAERIGSSARCTTLCEHPQIWIAGTGTGICRAATASRHALTQESPPPRLLGFVSSRPSIEAWAMFHAHVLISLAPRGGGGGVTKGPGGALQLATRCAPGAHRVGATGRRDGDADLDGMASYCVICRRRRWEAAKRARLAVKTKWLARWDDTLERRMKVGSRAGFLTPVNPVGGATIQRTSHILISCRAIDCPPGGRARDDEDRRGQVREPRRALRRADREHCRLPRRDRDRDRDARQAREARPRRRTRGRSRPRRRGRARRRQGRAPRGRRRARGVAPPLLRRLDARRRGRSSSRAHKLQKWLDSRRGAALARRWSRRLSGGEVAQSVKKTPTRSAPRAHSPRLSVIAICTASHCLRSRTSTPTASRCPRRRATTPRPRRWR